MFLVPQVKTKHQLVASEMLCNDGLHVFDLDEAEFVNTERCFSSFVSYAKKKKHKPINFLLFLYKLLHKSLL